MTHPRQHSGFATQAKRRNEEYVLCGTCGQRHPRAVTPPNHPDDATLREFLASLIVLILCGLAIWVWWSILDASRAVPSV